MSEDTSLSEFVGTSDDSAEADEPLADDETGTQPNEVDVEPARATYGWTPDGGACECCGDSVEKRWRDEDGMVCAGCKDW